MLGANIFTAEENEVLYDLVTFLLHSKDTVSKIDFIDSNCIFVLNQQLIFRKLKQEERLVQEQLIGL
jgi:hypothetical protein